MLAEGAGGGGESRDADQEAVHQDGDQRQRAISVGRDQLLDRPAQELARARQPQHPAPLQIGQERGGRRSSVMRAYFGTSPSEPTSGACHSWVSSIVPAASSSR